MYGDTDFSPPTRRIGDTVAGGLLAWQARSRTRELLTAGRVSALLGDHGRGVHGGGGGGLAVAALNATVPVVSFEELVMGGWSLALDVRARPARQLCVAIDILEQTGGMAHVDLSAANVMILFLDGAVPRLFLIDFDGFRRLRVPPVPISKDLPSGRSWGTPGCHSATFRKGTDTLVNTDGVAVVLRAEDADPLPRDTVLCQREIDAPQVPDKIAARWPEGWSLVQEARRSGHPARRCGVASWRGSSGDRSSPSNRPLLRLRGKYEDRLVRPWRPRGTFGRIDPELAWLGNSPEGDTLHFIGPLTARWRSRWETHWGDFDIRPG